MKSKLNIKRPRPDTVLAMLVFTVLIATVYFLDVPGVILMIVIIAVSFATNSKVIGYIGIGLLLAVSCSIILLGNDKNLTNNLSQLILGVLISIFIQTLRTSSLVEVIPKRSEEAPEKNTHSPQASQKSTTKTKPSSTPTRTVSTLRNDTKDTEPEEKKHTRNKKYVPKSNHIDLSKPQTRASTRHKNIQG